MLQGRGDIQPIASIKDLEDIGPVFYRIRLEGKNVSTDWGHTFSYFIWHKRSHEGRYDGISDTENTEDENYDDKDDDVDIEFDTE